jgi:hypothetical protein
VLRHLSKLCFRGREWTRQRPPRGITAEKRVHQYKSRLQHGAQSSPVTPLRCPIIPVLPTSPVATPPPLLMACQLSSVPAVITTPVATHVTCPPLITGQWRRPPVPAVGSVPPVATTGRRTPCPRAAPLSSWLVQPAATEQPPLSRCPPGMAQGQRQVKLRTDEARHTGRDIPFSEPQHSPCCGLLRFHPAHSTADPSAYT